MKIRAIKVLFTLLLVFVLIGCEYRAVEYTRPVSKTPNYSLNIAVDESVNQPIPLPPSLPADTTESLVEDTEILSSSPPQFPTN